VPFFYPIKVNSLQCCFVIAVDNKDTRTCFKKGMVFLKMGKKDSACISFNIAKDLGDTEAGKEIDSNCN
jgi:hypothetical protein